MTIRPEYAKYARMIDGELHLAPEIHAACYGVTVDEFAAVMQAGTGIPKLWRQRVVQRRKEFEAATGNDLDAGTATMIDMALWWMERDGS